MDNTHLDPAAPQPRVSFDPLQELRNLGDYRILRLLGEGGMGSVYLGYHEGLDRHVAVKVLADNLSSNQAYIDRFYREARSGALLNHPNIVRGFAIGQDKTTGRHFLILEYVDGPSTQALLEKLGRLPVGAAVYIALHIARALEHAHSHSLVHRDIKPDNILISRSGVAKLADLGLAKRIDEASHLTAHRQGFGTSYYMPYEQAMSAKSVDGRSDIYALGATLYHLLTGEVPFSGDNHLEVIDKKDHGAFTPPSKVNPEVPIELDRILEKMLARQPRDRYQTATELIHDLERTGLAVPSLNIPHHWETECAPTGLSRQDARTPSDVDADNQPTRLDLDMPGSEAAVKGQRRRGDRETRRQGDRETGRQGDKETRRQGDRETGRQGEGEKRSGGSLTRVLHVAAVPAMPIRDPRVAPPYRWFLLGAWLGFTVAVAGILVYLFIIK